jgi:cholesterol transport system auxiliary component
MNVNLPPYRAAAAFALRVLALVLCAVVSSCAVLGSKTPPPLTRYSLEASTASVNAATSAKTAPVLLVEVPHAAAGYESNRMVYTRQPQTQEVFANSSWADTPARMLAPLLVERLQQSGQFRAVLLSPSAAKASLRLDTTIVQLQQDFLQVPSRVHLRLQVTLLDNDTREVRAWRAINITRDATSEDAAGGAKAANAAVQDALQQLSNYLGGEIATCCTH